MIDWISISAYCAMFVLCLCPAFLCVNFFVLPCVVALFRFLVSLPSMIDRIAIPTPMPTTAHVNDHVVVAIPPTLMPTSTPVNNHLLEAIQQRILNQKAGTQLNGEIVQEQIYDSSTCKNDDCVICLEAFTKDQKIGVLVSCQHSFHGHCIKEWLLVNPICPICRHSMIRS
ncbi:unnamed protein product [Lactuca virosa]|uniref:RING-type E3 ubiquitin transferase n=1 Tax=Lactuca virosa TaxID=75947 RepID=A0AAU9M9G5_9ASTR|nr:unnamed protein product [Lactuca virosa]